MNLKIKTKDAELKRTAFHFNLLFVKKLIFLLHHREDASF